MIIEPNFFEMKKAVKSCEDHGFPAFVAESIKWAKPALQQSIFFSAIVISLNSSYLTLLEICLDLNIPCLLVYEEKSKKDLQKIIRYIGVIKNAKNYYQKNIPILSKDEGWEKIISKATELIDIKIKTRN